MCTWCWNKASFSDKIDDIIATLTSLNARDKIILHKRYAVLVGHIEVQMKRTSFFYNVLSLIITIGSILVPALISVQEKPMTKYNYSQDELETYKHNIYWVSWSISLAVTISNGIIKLFAIDKMYITRHLRYNDLKKEGWLFFQLSGPYKNFKDHKSALPTFAFNIEIIKSHQIKEEYVPENNLPRTDMTDTINSHPNNIPNYRSNINNNTNQYNDIPPPHQSQPTSSNSNDNNNNNNNNNNKNNNNNNNNNNKNNNNNSNFFGNNNTENTNMGNNNMGNNNRNNENNPNNEQGNSEGFASNNWWDNVDSKNWRDWWWGKKPTQTNDFSSDNNTDRDETNV